MRKPLNLCLFEKVGIDVALSARGAALMSGVHQIDGGRANLLAILEEDQARVVELTVPADSLFEAIRRQRDLQRAPR